MARSSVPRYDATTSGSLRTLVRCALGDDLARLEAVDAVADRQDQRQVVLDDDECRVELLLHALDQRPERLGLALRDARGGLVEADHAGRDREHRRQLDDAPGAGRELGDEPVGVAAETEEVDQLRGLGALAPFGLSIAGGYRAVLPERRAARAPRARVARSRAPSARGTASRPGRCGRGPAWRAGARAGPLTSRPSSSTRPVGRHVAADRVEQCRLARAVRADEPDHLARHRAEVDRVDRDDAAEAHTTSSRVGERAAVGVRRQRVRLGDARQRRAAVR